MNEKSLYIPTSTDTALKVTVRNPPPNLIDPWLNKMHTGDCVELMNRMPVDSVDLIVTSPPYNLRNGTGSGMKDGRGGKWKNAALINGYAEHEDNMPHNEYVEWQRSCLSVELTSKEENCHGRP